MEIAFLCLFETAIKYTKEKKILYLTKTQTQKRKHKRAVIT